MKKSLVVLLAVFTVLVFAGCGNKESKTSLLEEINKKGKVVVGTDASFAPYEFVEDGKIVGYGADILAEIMKNWNVSLEQLDTPFTGILAGLEEKKFDFVATAVTVTPERKEKFALTTPIGDSTILLFTKKDNDEIKDVSDISGKVIGCNIASAPEKELVKFNEKMVAEGKPEVEIKTYPNHQSMVMDLENGRLDGLIGTGIVVISASKNGAKDFKIVGPFSNKKYVSWVVRKEDKELLDFLNSEILKLKESGKLAELQEKWFGASWELP